MTAIPSMGSPSGDPSAGYPNPYASGVRARYQIEWQALWGGRSCEYTNEHMNTSGESIPDVLIPDSTGLKVGWGTRQNSSSQSVARLTAIHNTLGDWGELSGWGRKRLAIRLG